MEIKQKNNFQLITEEDQKVSSQEAAARNSWAGLPEPKVLLDLTRLNVLKFSSRFFFGGRQRQIQGC